MASATSAPHPNEPGVSADIGVVWPWHLVQVHECVAHPVISRGHVRRPLLVVDSDDGVPVWESNRNDQPVFAGDMSNEVNLAMYVELLEHRPQRVDPGATLQSATRETR